jgi:two-component system, chemotaxis family, protein-glutamate methylesterase/glutaminase
MRTNPSRSTFPIVCLGGSAGALPAYRAILRSAPADSGVAFIVVAHRRLGFDHLLGPLLEAVTTMPVSAVEQGQYIAPNTVVLVPAQHDVAIVDGRLVLSTRAKTFGWPTTITSFLQALAIDAGTRAVAVILSGLADDGSAALAAIKAAGGATFAQADAEWPEMPRHAIETGFVDFVLSSENIGRALGIKKAANTTLRSRHQPQSHTPNLKTKIVLRYELAKSPQSSRLIRAHRHLARTQRFRRPLYTPMVGSQRTATALRSPDPYQSLR